MRARKAERVLDTRQHHPLDEHTLDLFLIAPQVDNEMLATADKSLVRLESGDVLVFGGPARGVVHALTRVYASAQPAWLRMRSGRLNLTFREFEPIE